MNSFNLFCTASGFLARKAMAELLCAGGRTTRDRALRRDWPVIEVCLAP